MIGRDPKPRREPKAGAFGVFMVVVYGVACVVAVFLAAYFWLTGDAALAAAFGLGSLAVPVTFGFFMAEAFDQRIGVYGFVLAAAVIAGAAGASAYYERDDFLERRDLDGPDIIENEIVEPEGNAPATDVMPSASVEPSAP